MFNCRVTEIDNIAICSHRLTVRTQDFILGIQVRFLLRVQIIVLFVML